MVARGIVMGFFRHTRNGQADETLAAWNASERVQMQLGAVLFSRTTVSSVAMDDQILAFPAVRNGSE